MPEVDQRELIGQPRLILMPQETERQFLDWRPSDLYSASSRTTRVQPCGFIQIALVSCLVVGPEMVRLPTNPLALLPRGVQGERKTAPLFAGSGLFMVTPIDASGGVSQMPLL